MLDRILALGQIEAEFKNVEGVEGVMRDEGSPISRQVKRHRRSREKEFSSFPFFPSRKTVIFSISPH